MGNWLSNLLQKDRTGEPKFGTMSIHETDYVLAKEMLSKSTAVSAISELESSFKTYYKSVAACSFGHEPLGVVLDVLEEGALIIAPAFIHRITVDAFAKKKLRVKWVDIELESYGPSFVELKKAVEGGADALFLPHFLGIPSNHLLEIMALCQAKGIWVIEDCRQAIGGLFDKKPLGSFGDIALFSFNAMMPINTIQGGVVIIKENAGFVEIVKKNQAEARASSLSEKELLKLFIKFYEDRKIPDKGLLDIKKDNIFWEKKWTFVQIDEPVSIHPAQAVLAKTQFEQAESFSYYRQNHLRYWQEIANEHQWEIPNPIMMSAPGWLRAPILIANNDQEKVEELKETTEISQWYGESMLSDEIDLTLFPNTKRASTELFLFPTEM